MEHLRPVERVVLKLTDQGLSPTEIGRRLGRSAAHIERVIDYTKIPRPGGRRHRTGLRPLERRVLDLRAAGLGHDEIGQMFRRSPAHMRRVEGLAYLRKGMNLLSE